MQRPHQWNLKIVIHHGNATQTEILRLFFVEFELLLQSCGFVQKINSSERNTSDVIAERVNVKFRYLMAGEFK